MRESRRLKRQDAKTPSHRNDGSDDLAGPNGCLWQPTLSDGTTCRKSSPFGRSSHRSGPRARRAAGPHKVGPGFLDPVVSRRTRASDPGISCPLELPRPTWRLGVLAFTNLSPASSRLHAPGAPPHLASLSTPHPPRFAGRAVRRTSRFSLLTSCASAPHPPPPGVSRISRSPASASQPSMPPSSSTEPSVRRRR